MTALTAALQPSRPTTPSPARGAADARRALLQRPARRPGPLPSGEELARRA